MLLTATAVVSLVLIARPRPAQCLDDRIEIHGFASQGWLISTKNKFYGPTKGGSFEFAEVALNVTTQLTEKLRAGLQLVSRDFFELGNFEPDLDWGFLGYRVWDWLEMRAGRMKVPYGLYGEIADIDAARLPVLLPQSIYDANFRLLSFTGVSATGDVSLGPVGSLNYNLFTGDLTDPDIRGFDVAMRQAIGGRLFWETPFAGLRLSGTTMLFDFRFDYTMAADQLITFKYRDGLSWVASAEYNDHNLLMAFEYGRWNADITGSLAALAPSINLERYYAMTSYQFTTWLQAGGYYSVSYWDRHDKDGTGSTIGISGANSHSAWQKDLALTVRIDVNPHWLFKLEGHRIDGTTTLWMSDSASASDLVQDWALFMVRTTVSF
jgi:hypothetical protein